MVGVDPMDAGFVALRFDISFSSLLFCKRFTQQNLQSIQLALGRGELLGHERYDFAWCSGRRGTFSLAKNDIATSY